MWRSPYSRSPHEGSSSLNRQSTTATEESLRRSASVAVSMSVWKVIIDVMARSAELRKLTGIAGQLGAFVAERHPLAVAHALDALDAVAGGRPPLRQSSI